MRVLCLFLSALIVYANAQAATDVTDQSTADTGPSSPPNVVTTAAPPPVTTPSPPPVTTPAPPPVTTPGPVTTPPAVPTSTAAPATKTGAPEPTTQAAPTPSPYILKPTTATWGLNDPETNNTCIMVSMAMQFNFTYTMTGNVKTCVLHNLLPNATVSGNCTEDPNNQAINLLWDEFCLTLNFVKYGDEYALHNMTLIYNVTDENFPNVIPSEMVQTEVCTKTLDNGDSEYKIETKHSYKCSENYTINFLKNVSSNVYDVVSTIREFNYQAFGVPDHKITDQYVECSADFSTSDIVPIAVGCALAALVLIVLVAYLIGRRRSRQKGGSRWTIKDS